MKMNFMHPTVEPGTCQSISDGNSTELWEYLEMAMGPKQMDDYHTLVIITLLYITVFITGVLGNLSVCLVIVRSSHLHTAMNYYLVSLAMADLMIIILGIFSIIDIGKPLHTLIKTSLRKKVVT